MLDMIMNERERERERKRVYVDLKGCYSFSGLEAVQEG
jgi:hypothetical protein